MYLYQHFPYAERVQLDVLALKYNFPQSAINEIKENWKLDPTTQLYVKPGGKYDTFSADPNPQNKFE